MRSPEQIVNHKFFIWLNQVREAVQTGLSTNALENMKLSEVDGNTGILSFYNQYDFNKLKKVK